MECKYSLVALPQKKIFIMKTQSLNLTHNMPLVRVIAFVTSSHLFHNLNISKNCIFLYFVMLATSSDVIASFYTALSDCLSITWPQKNKHKIYSIWEWRLKVVMRSAAFAFMLNLSWHPWSFISTWVIEY